MKRLALYSERFQASGGMGARTAHRALGTPRVGFWSLFVRETLQNSWDARLQQDGPISYGIHSWTATRAQRRLLSETVLADVPPRSSLPMALADVDLRLLVVADSGTRGLTGPTRADFDPDSVPDGRTDFVDLVRDTGRRASKGLAGGTYGFGKAVLHEASAVDTVVIYSRSTHAGRPVSRLIGMAVEEDEYTYRRVRYTGRHWWGELFRGFPEPVTGRSADAIAEKLGMAPLISGATGTAIMIVAPCTPDEHDGPSPDHIMPEIAGSAIEYAWPHLGSAKPPRTIDLWFTDNGCELTLPDPSTDQRLALMSEAYVRCVDLLSGKAGEGDYWPWHHRILRSSRPSRRLGALVWRHHGAIAPHLVRAAEPRCEIALLRGPRFVVSYLEGPRNPSGQSTYGVFLADPDLDEEFAKAEPPTHDEWVPTPNRYADPVRQTLKRIAEELKPERITATAPPGQSQPGIVRVASALGGLLDGQYDGGDPAVPWSPQPSRSSGNSEGVSGGTTSDAGGGADTAPWSGGFAGGGTAPIGRPSAGGGAGTPGPWHGRRPRVQIDGAPRLVIIDGRVVVEFPFVVQVPPGADARVRARPEVLTEGGRETEPPAGAELPEVIGWRNLTDGTVTTEDVVIATEGVSRWTVLVTQPADAAISVTLTTVDAR